MSANDRRLLTLIVVIASAGIGSVGDLAAQDVLEPADTIRVVETEDRLRGGIVRVVVDDLWPSEILRVQIALASAGYDPGVRSARLDPATRRSLRRFQIARGLRICGCFGYETLIALAITPHVVVVEGAGIVSSHEHHGVVVIIPRRGVRKTHSSSGVFVGHAPAIGAGQVAKTRDRGVFPRSSVGVRETRRSSGTPSRIRSGDSR